MSICSLVFDKCSVGVGILRWRTTLSYWAVHGEWSQNQHVRDQYSFLLVFDGKGNVTMLITIAVIAEHIFMFLTWVVISFCCSVCSSKKNANPIEKHLNSFFDLTCLLLEKLKSLVQSASTTDLSRVVFLYFCRLSESCLITPRLRSSLKWTVRTEIT